MYGARPPVLTKFQVCVIRNFMDKYILLCESTRVTTTDILFFPWYDILPLRSCWSPSCDHGLLCIVAMSSCESNNNSNHIYRTYHSSWLFTPDVVRVYWYTIPVPGVSCQIMCSTWLDEDVCCRCPRTYIIKHTC